MAPAILRPCTPLYAHVRPVRPQITPSTPSTPMGVHCTPIKNLYARIIACPWAYMGVHVRPQTKSQQFFVGVHCTPMYAHVRPCTPTRNFVWAYNVHPQKNTYAHKNGYCLQGDCSINTSYGGQLPAIFFTSFSLSLLQLEISVYRNNHLV